MPTKNDWLNCFLAISYSTNMYAAQIEIHNTPFEVEQAQTYEQLAHVAYDVFEEKKQKEIRIEQAKTPAYSYADSSPPTTQETIDSINEIRQERTHIKKQLSDAYDELRDDIAKEDIKPITDRIKSLEKVKDQNLERYKNKLKEIENRPDKQEILDYVRHSHKIEKVATKELDLY